MLDLDPASGNNWMEERPRRAVSYTGGDPDLHLTVFNLPHNIEFYLFRI